MRSFTTSSTNRYTVLETRTTYPETSSAFIDEIMGNCQLKTIRKIMQEGHPTLSATNKARIVQRFLESENLPVPQENILMQVNEPVYEILRVFAAEEQNELPNAGELICATTATANSGNENEAVVALGVIGRSPSEQSTILSTIAEDGETGVSHVVPRHAAVTYNHTAPLQTWPEVSQSLFKQLCDKANETYTTIFHWGCISENWQLTPGNPGHEVSSWQLHEHWNLLFTIAMMRHALATLKTNGKLYLKIRVFNNSETLGLTTLLAHAFKSYKMFANYRQTSMGFVVFVGYGFKGTDATPEIAAQLERCRDYTPTNIFLNAIMQKPESKDIMQACQNMKKEMLLNRCKIFTAYLYTLRLIQQILRKPQLEEQTMQTLVMYLTPMYDQFTLDAIETAVNTATRELRKSKQSELFLRLMNSKWMLQNG